MLFLIGKISNKKYNIDAIREAYNNVWIFFDTTEAYSPNLHGIGHYELIIRKSLKNVRNKVLIAWIFFWTHEKWINMER